MFQFPSCLMFSTKVPYCNSHQQIKMVTFDNAYLLHCLTLKNYMCNITSFGESKHFGFAFIDPPYSLSWHHFSFKQIPNQKPIPTTTQKLAQVRNYCSTPHFSSHNAHNPFISPIPTKVQRKFLTWSARKGTPFPVHFKIPTKKLVVSSITALETNANDRQL